MLLPPLPHYLTRLYIDDIRTPSNHKDFVILRNFNDSIAWIKGNGLYKIGYIAFDHDLGNESKNALQIAKQITDWEMDGLLGRLPNLFMWSVHSDNPDGAKNIRSHMI